MSPSMSTIRFITAETHASLQTDDLDRQREFIERHVANLDGQEFIRKIHKELKENPEAAAELATRSAKHPNGFDTINLVGDFPKTTADGIASGPLPPYRVRLHIWWPDEAAVVEDIHNHGWDFSSEVVSGALRFTTYRETYNGDPHFHYRIRRSSQFDPSDVREVRLSRGLDVTMNAGTKYSFDYRELHRVSPAEQSVPTATLVWIGGYREPGSDIFTESPRHASALRKLGHSWDPETLVSRIGRLIESW